MSDLTSNSNNLPQENSLKKSMRKVKKVKRIRNKKTGEVTETFTIVEIPVEEPELPKKVEVKEEEIKTEKKEEQELQPKKKVVKKQKKVKKQVVHKLENQENTELEVKENNSELQSKKKVVKKTIQTKIENQNITPTEIKENKLENINNLLIPYQEEIIKLYKILNNFVGYPSYNKNVTSESINQTVFKNTINYQLFNENKQIFESQLKELEKEKPKKFIIFHNRNYNQIGILYDNYELIRKCEDIICQKDCESYDDYLTYLNKFEEFCNKHKLCFFKQLFGYSYALYDYCDINIMELYEYINNEI